MPANIHLEALRRHRIIQDEFSEQKMSRQRRWQKRKERDGLCSVCGQKAVMNQLCLKHAVAQREHQRKARGSKKRIKSKSYRLEQEYGQLHPV